MTKKERRQTRNKIIKGAAKGLRSCGDKRSLSTLKKIVKNRMMFNGDYAKDFSFKGTV